MTERRHLRAVRGAQDGGSRGEAAYALPGREGVRREPPVPTIAVLKARSTADAEGLVTALVRAFRAAGKRPAVLWTERTDALEEGVVTAATSAALFPEALRAAAEEAHLARFAHMGAQGEARAAAELFAGLGDATHAVLDGRLLGVARAHVGVVVTGDEIGDVGDLVRALRAYCDVEVYEPSDAIATALVLSLGRRA